MGITNPARRGRVFQLNIHPNLTAQYFRKPHQNLVMSKDEKRASGVETYKHQVGVLPHQNRLSPVDKTA